MTDTGHMLLAAIRIVVFFVGVAVTYVAFKAYRRQGTRYLRDAALAFGIITLGVLVEGFLFQVVKLDLTTAHIIESVAIGIGFLVLLRSFLD